MIFKGNLDIAHLKPYPSNKDSGVPWIGQLPNHWEIKKLPYIFCFVKGSRANREVERLN